MLDAEFSAPAKEPSSREEAERIKGFVEFVCRNGYEFEDVVRSKEQGNPNYDFLENGESSGYYRWMLFCKSKSLTEDVINDVFFAIVLTLFTINLMLISYKSFFFISNKKHDSWIF